MKHQCRSKASCACTAQNPKKILYYVKTKTKTNTKTESERESEGESESETEREIDGRGIDEKAEKRRNRQSSIKYDGDRK